MTYGGNNFNDFPENQLTIFYQVPAEILYNFYQNIFTAKRYFFISLLDIVHQLLY